MPSTLDLVTDLSLVVFGIVYSYVAYTAIAISRALSSRVYRNQALGSAGVAIVMIALALGSVFGPSDNIFSTGIIEAVLLLGFWFPLFIGFYYYIDASIRAARLTDPLYRDTFHWTRVRLAFYVYDISAAIVFPIAAAVRSYGYPEGGIGGILQAEIPVLIIIFSGLVVLPIAIRRSKDKTLKRQLTWFAIYLIAIAFLAIPGSFVSNLPDVVGGIPLFAGAYPLYRSAKSLVPLYKFDKVQGKSG